MDSTILVIEGHTIQVRAMDQATRARLAHLAASPASTEQAARLCLGFCQRRLAHGLGWANLLEPHGSLMFEDMTAVTLARLTRRVIRLVLGP